MAGLIRDEDIELVRQRARIDDVIGQYVQLRSSGAGVFKGLCPFHDEKTPSFQVSVTKGLYYCFGCHVGGDLVDFLRRKENLSFVEAIQNLADRYGVQLRIVEGGSVTKNNQPSLRKRMLEANQAASEFFMKNLRTSQATPAVKLLAGRGFGADVAEKFSIGYAPRGGHQLADRLAKLGFDDELLIKAGLIRQKGRWDFFQGRLIWPIKDSAGNVLGFGARKIFDDDKMPAKYLNTPETPVYKKSQVLYGLDLARKNIGAKSQAVVMEGYTDVMAAHCSGIDTAVASCGTAFGDEHAKLLTRLIGDDSTHKELSGITFTFDGDEAGQRAALKAFQLDSNFITQAYVAVDPAGLDPCDLRMSQGDQALVELLKSRVPIYEFVMKNEIAKYDLNRSDAKLAAVRAVANLIGNIRDSSRVRSYCRDLAGLVGMDIEETRSEVIRTVKYSARRQNQPSGYGANRQAPAVRQNSPSQLPVPVGVADSQPARPEYKLPNPAEPKLAIERINLILLVRNPNILSQDSWSQISAADFTDESYREIFQVIINLLPQAASLQAQDWNRLVREQVFAKTGAKELVDLVYQLEFDEMLVAADPTEKYALGCTVRLNLNTVDREINQIKSKITMANPDGEDIQQLMASAQELSEYRLELANFLASGDFG